MRIQFVVLLAALAGSAAAADLRWSSYIVNDLDLRFGDPGPAVARDAQGNVFIAASTRSVESPATPGAYQPALRTDNCRNFAGERCRDLFLSKYDSSGRMLWSTYLGTPEDDLATGIAVDAAGNVYVGATANAQPCRFVCAHYAFVAKLSAAGDRALAMFPFQDVRLTGIALDGSASLYVAGTTTAGDIFVGKLNSEIDAFAYATRLGDDRATVRGFAVTPTGEVMVVGQTSSADFPTTANAFQPRSGGDYDGFVVFLERSGAVRWSSYLGGEGNDTADRVAFGPSGRAYVAIEEGVSGLIRLAIIEAGVPRLVSRASLGRNAAVGALVFDPDGKVVLGGRLVLRGWPITDDAIEPVMYGESGFVTVLDETGSRVLYSTYIGRTRLTAVTGIATGQGGEVYVVGQVDQTDDFPVTSSFPEIFGRGFVGAIHLTASPPPGPRIRAVVNSASFSGGPLARGEVISIFGEQIGPETPVAAQTSQGLFPTRVGDVEVLANGVPLPLLYVSRSQVNAAVPMLTQHPTIEIVVRNAHGVTPPFRLSQYVAAIGVFTRDGSGRGQAAALNQDNTPNSPANPAKRGTVVQLWVTGAGLTNPPQQDGRLALSEDRSTIGLPIVRLRTGGGSELVLSSYAGAAPGMIAGVAQINVRIPDNAPTGPQVRLEIQNGLPQDVTVAVAE